MNRNQILVVLACILLGGAIFFFGKKTKMAASSAPLPSLEVVALDKASMLTRLKSQLSTDDLVELEGLESRAGAENQTALISFWEKRGMWVASAFIFEEMAVTDTTTSSLVDAGNRYLAYADMTGDSLEIAFVNQKAIEMLQKAYDKDPSNLNVEADLAKTMALTSPAPMPGIQRLLGIIAKDSTHLKANYHLAQLSIKSNQLEKAKQRFQTINKNQPWFPEAWLGLGEVYYSQGNTDSALMALQVYRGLVRDPIILEQVDVYMEKVRNSKN